MKSFEVENMGAFSVPDADRILSRFEQEGIAFEINRNQGAGRSTDPYSARGTARLIEIWVDIGEVERASEIIHGDAKV